MLERRVVNRDGTRRYRCPVQSKFAVTRPPPEEPAVRTALTAATRFEIGGAAARAFEQHREQLGRQQSDILREKAEEQSHQEVRGALWVTASCSQGVREGCELSGGHLRYICRAAVGAGAGPDR